MAEEGASEALGEIASEDRQAVLRTAVSRHIDKLDDQFLAVLNQYIGSAMKAEQAETVRILMGVREEVLNAVGDKLPPEVQLVDLLTTVPTVESIDKVLAIANGGGGRFRGSLRVPACSMEKARAPRHSAACLACSGEATGGPFPIPHVSGGIDAFAGPRRSLAHHRTDGGQGSRGAGRRSLNLAFEGGKDPAPFMFLILPIE